MPTTFGAPVDVVVTRATILNSRMVGLVLSAGAYAGTRLLDITSGTRASLWLANLIDLDILGPDKHDRRQAKFGMKEILWNGLLRLER